MILNLPAYIYYLLSAIVSCIISLFIVKRIIYLAGKNKIYDKPDDIRKFHGSQIPSLGGIGIFAGYLVFLMLFLFLQPHYLNYLPLASAILFFTGIYDDLKNLSPLKKLIAQLAASFIIIYFGDIRIISFYGFLGIDMIPYWLSIGITTFLCTFFINVFNFIDGIDGLACVIAILYTSVLGVLFAIMNEPYLGILQFCIAGATLGLLFYNKSPAKIYMGDTGSMLLGFNIFIFALILLLAYPEAEKYTTIGRVLHPPLGAVLILFTLIALPVFDALRVFALRISKGISPLKADRSHFHYYLLDSGFTHSQAVLILFIDNVFLLSLVYILQDLNPYLLVALVLIYSFFMLYLILKIRKRRV